MTFDVQQFEIKELVSQIELFKSLHAPQLEAIINSGVIKEYHDQSIIVLEGDIATKLFLLLENSVQVFTVNDARQTIVLARLEKGSVFGEQGYLNHFVRTASIRALGYVTVVEIEYDVLDEILQKSGELRDAFEKISLQRNIHTLQCKLPFIDEQIKAIFEKKSWFSRSTTKVEYYKAGDVIFNAQDTSDSVYFISYGTIELAFDNASTNKILVQKNSIFGELGVINKAPRAATATALNNCMLIKISSDQFLKAFKSNTRLKSFIEKLSNVYVLPNNKAIVEQYIGNYLGSDAIISKYKIANGSVVECFKVIEQPIFTMKIADATSDQVIEYKKGQSLERQIGIKDQKIVSITSIGDWEEVNLLCEMLLDEVKIDSTMIQSFVETGHALNLSSKSAYHYDDIICNCMRVPYEKIHTAIDAGAKSIEDISNATGACTACGSCKPTLLSLLGESAWIAARIHLKEKYYSDVAAFLIKPIYNIIYNFKPGQHITIKLQINNQWIDRTYTITSSTTHSDGFYEIIIKRYKNATLSPWLFENAATPVYARISKPNGNFLLKESTQPILAFAGGIGITPFIAYIRELIGHNKKQNLHVIHSVLMNKEAILPSDLVEPLKNDNHIAIELWNTDEKGLLTLEAVKQIIESTHPEYIYICGPPIFEETILEHVKALGIDDQKIIREQFIPAVV